jgi:Aldo/keto reductase family
LTFQTRITMKLHYKIFGKHTGLRVSEFSLGTGMFGAQWGYGAEPEEARRIFDAYAEAGGNFIDTADGYQFGQSEQLAAQTVWRRVWCVLRPDITAGSRTLLAVQASSPAHRYYGPFRHPPKPAPLSEISDFAGGDLECPDFRPSPNGPLGQTEAGLPGGIRRVDDGRTLAALLLRRHRD